MSVQNEVGKVLFSENSIKVISLVELAYSFTLLNLFVECNELIYPSEFKDFFLLTSLIVSLSICMAGLFLSKDSKVKFSAIDIVILLLTGWIIALALILRVETLSLQLVTTSFVSLLIFSQYFRKANNSLNVIVISILTIGTLEALLGSLQLYGIVESKYLFKVIGNFSNPGPFGIYVSSTITFSLGLYLHSSSKLIKNVAFAAILFCMLILPSTDSRAAWIGGGIGCCYVLIRKYHFTFPTIKKLLIPLILLSLFFLYALWKYKEQSANGRLLVWKVGFGMIQENPFGIGLGNFKNRYPFYQADYFSKQSYKPTSKEVELSDNVEYAFCDPLQFAIEAGIVGISLGLILVAFLLFYPISDGCNAHAARGAVISIIIASLFSYPLQITSMWWLFLTYSLFIFVQLSSFVVEIPWQRYSKSIVSILFIVFAIYILSWTRNDYRSKHRWYLAKVSFINGYSKASERIYSGLVKAIDYNKEPLLDYGKVLYKNGSVVKCVEVLSFASQFIADPFLFCNLGDAYISLNMPLEAENAYKMAINMNPNRLYPRYLLAMMYFRTKNIDKADSMANYIINMPVKIKSSATSEMIAEMKRLKAK